MYRRLIYLEIRHQRSQFRMHPSKMSQTLPTKGGDIQGLIESIEEGYLDELGSKYLAQPCIKMQKELGLIEVVTYFYVLSRLLAY